MHCISIYPLLDEDANLARINSLKKQFNCPVGYSGHESGLVPSLAAVSLGISSLERHITLDRGMYGSDQSASLEPVAFQSLVSSAKKIVACMGDGLIDPHPREYTIAKKLRAHILCSD